MKRIYIVAALILSLLTPLSKAAYIYSIQSGDWSQTSTWSGGSVPACGDSILISVSHTVTITNQITYNCSSKTSVVIKGVLEFDGGNKLTMPCDSRVYIVGGGAVTSDGGGNSNRIEVCSQVLWTAAVGQISGPSCLPSNLPGCSQVTPVELISFEGTQCGDNICMRWSTATEHLNDFFVVQKLSGDIFVDFVTVDTKAVGGASKRLLNYDAQDLQPSSGINYYRLRQVDIDGSFSYSKIIAIDHKTENRQATIYPNPSQGTFTVRLDGQIAINLSILDSSGNVVRSETFTVPQQIDVSGLAPGLYHCLVRSRDQVQATTVIVQ